MLSIILLRLKKLKGEYYVFLIMTALSLVLAFIFSSAYNSDYTPMVLIVNNDDSAYSQKAIDELVNSDTFNYKIVSYDKATEEVRKGSALAAIVIKENFGESIDNNNTPTLGIIKTKNDRDIMVLQSIMNSITSKMISNIKIAQNTADYIGEITDANKDELFKKAYDNAVKGWKYQKTININVSTLEADTELYYDNTIHSIIGFSLFFSMYTIVFAIGEILNDRKYRTWQRILVSPISKTSMLGGNLVVSFLVGVVQIVILFAASQFLFGVDYGSNFAALATILIVFIFTVTSLGLFLSGIVKNHAQLSALTPIVLTSTAMLGGTMWPLEIVNSDIILGLANITPQKWAIQGVKALAVYNEGFEGIVTPAIVLLGMGLVFFGLGVKLVKYD